MTRFTKVMMAATALSMMAGVAFAQSNEAITEQDGSGNDLRVNQIGSHPNNTGTRNFADVTQDGDDNNGELHQLGTDNVAGDSTNGNVLQSGDDNVFDIDQLSDFNRVGMVRQISPSGGGSVAGPTQNTLTILQQSGDDNRIGTVIQNNNAPSANDINSATITQTGSDSRVTRLEQLGSDQSATVTQIGDGNRLNNLKQFGGTGNDITASFNGDDNGEPFLGGPSSLVGVVRSDIIQEGNLNFVDLDVDGNDTAYGIDQFGDDNTVGTLDIDGDGNSIGVSQTSIIGGGVGNTLAAGTIAGDENDIGVIQSGQNLATLNLRSTSSENEIYIDQLGSNDANVDVTGGLNDVSVEQTSAQVGNGSAEADVTVVGMSNYLDVVQVQNGNATSTIDVRITGDFNNNTGQSFTGDAGSVFFSRAPGLLEQLGSNNDATITVEGDSNLFSIRQSSAGNSITASIDGNSNQMVIAQSGGDTANVQQTGNFNNVGVSQ